MKKFKRIANRYQFQTANRITIEYDSMSEGDIEEIEKAMSMYSDELEKYESIEEEALYDSSSGVSETSEQKASLYDISSGVSETSAINWSTACPNMLKNICFVMMGKFLPTGGRLRSSSTGGSVANARLANESMARLTQSIWMAPSGEPWKATAPIMARATATMLTVN
jgi:hypothetical protein